MSTGALCLALIGTVYGSLALGFLVALIQANYSRKG